MFSQKSLRAKYALELASASTMLILIFSALLYHYVRITIFEGPAQILASKANELNYSNLDEIIAQSAQDSSNKIQISYAHQNSIDKPKFIKSDDENNTYLTLLYPLGERVIALKTKTTIYSELIKQILLDIVALNATMIFLISFFALFLSRILLSPLRGISQKISAIDEKVLKPLDTNNIAPEFSPLIKNVNRLIERIQTFALYQKELFIGIAHELKTPLAVMKTKNEVTLLKPRDSEKYIETINQNITSIDNMNKMISSVLEIGRQEGDQFEDAKHIDIIDYIGKLGTNFKILAKTKGKDISLNLSPASLNLKIQPLLFTHIIQNFTQNAIKFALENSEISISSCVKDDEFIVEISNLGDEIDENIDLFAPFKRIGNKGGAGLGLFLAKNAATALGATISIKNRTDGAKGVISSVCLKIKE